MTLYLVKLGGSRITLPGEEKRVDGTSLRDLCCQIGKWWEKVEGDSLIVVHGAGSFGHKEAKRIGIRGGDREGRPIEKKDLPGIALIHREVRELHLRVLKDLHEVGVPAYSHPPYPFVSWQGSPGAGRRADITSLKLLQSARWGLVPVTFGDVVEDPSLRYSVISGDHLICFSAMEGCRAGERVKVIFVMSERGIREGERYLQEIKPRVARELLGRLGRGVSSRGEEDVTGGISLKLKVGIKLAEAGVEVVYTDGREGSLYEELKGRSSRASRIIKEVKGER